MSAEPFDDLPFLPGVPAAHVLARLAQAGGNEVASGKLASPESSAALAVNAFGWFVERPARLPPLRGLEPAEPPVTVDVEYCARLPWSGGRHPWLDAVVETRTLLIGIESKRFEPYRDVPSVAFSDAYDRPVWGPCMTGYERLRDRLKDGSERFDHLDAAQLVKHAFGLVTAGRRTGLSPVLVYLYAEPAAHRGRPIPATKRERHRDEIARFAEAVSGDAVRFVALSYAEWLETWSGCDAEVAAHGRALRATFAP